VPWKTCFSSLQLVARRRRRECCVDRFLFPFFPFFLFFSLERRPFKVELITEPDSGAGRSSGKKRWYVPLLPSLCVQRAPTSANARAATKRGRFRPRRRSELFFFFPFSLFFFQLRHGGSLITKIDVRQSIQIALSPRPHLFLFLPPIRTTAPVSTKGILHRHSLMTGRARLFFFPPFPSFLPSVRQARIGPDFTIAAKHPRLSIVFFFFFFFPPSSFSLLGFARRTQGNRFRGAENVRAGGFSLSFPSPLIQGFAGPHQGDQHRGPRRPQLWCRIFFFPFLPPFVCSGPVRHRRVLGRRANRGCR